VFEKKHKCPSLFPLQPVTVPKPFNLGLDRRIAERKSYQLALEKRQKDAEERERTTKLEKEEEEKKELKAYRKSLNFKVRWCDEECDMCWVLWFLVLWFFLRLFLL